MAVPSINEFLDSLGVRLAVRRASWDGVIEATDTVVMKLWFHNEEPGSDGKSILIWSEPRAGTKNAPIGRAERKRSIAHMESGKPTYAVMRHGKDATDPDAQRYDGEHLRELKGIDRRKNGDIYAKVESLISLDEFLQRTGEQADLALAKDIEDIERRHPDPGHATQRLRLIQARMGQGRYRAELLAKWGGACAVTGCTNKAVIIASHAMAWAAAEDKQRLDPSNGLPLIANLDRLFDKHLIAFDPDTGKMLVSSELSNEDRQLFGIPAPLRKSLTAEQATYLRHHLKRFQTAQEDANT